MDKVCPLRERLNRAVIADGPETLTLRGVEAMKLECQKDCTIPTNRAVLRLDEKVGAHSRTDFPTRTGRHGLT